MAENRGNCHGGMNGSYPKENVCICCNRVLDSCRDKDCFEDIKVYLTDFGQEIIERTGNIRVKCAKILWTDLTVEPVQFNRGFYNVYVRFYVKIVVEACVCLGKTQEIEGIAVCEKKVILYGSEGSVNIFKSDPETDGFCAPMTRGETGGSNLPVAVCEVVDPVVLDIKVAENKGNNCCCCCCVDEIPERICCSVGGNLTDGNGDSRSLYVTLGFFSVIRIERPAQFMITASEYCIPEKECTVGDTDSPCDLFKKMAFPVSEFCPPPYKHRGCCE